MTPGNFLALEPLIIARLKAALPPHVHVLAAAELADMQWAHQPTPAVHVMYGGYSVERNDVPAFVVITQTWLTVIVTRNLRDMAGGHDARQDAGALAAPVFDALHQWRAAGEDGKPAGAAPLKLVNAPRADFDDGHFYLPLAWQTTINLGADKCPL